MTSKDALKQQLFNNWENEWHWENMTDDIIIKIQWHTAMYNSWTIFQERKHYTSDDEHQHVGSQSRFTMRRMFLKIIDTTGTVN